MEDLEEAVRHIQELEYDYDILYEEVDSARKHMVTWRNAYDDLKASMRFFEAENLLEGEVIDLFKQVMIDIRDSKIKTEALLNVLSNYSSLCK